MNEESYVARLIPFILNMLKKEEQPEPEQPKHLVFYDLDKHIKLNKQIDSIPYGEAYLNSFTADTKSPFYMEKYKATIGENEYIYDSEEGIVTCDFFDNTNFPNVNINIPAEYITDDIHFELGIVAGFPVYQTMTDVTSDLPTEFPFNVFVEGDPVDIIYTPDEGFDTVVVDSIWVGGEEDGRDIKDDPGVVVGNEVHIPSVDDIITITVHGAVAV